MKILETWLPPVHVWPSVFSIRYKINTKSIFPVSKASGFCWNCQKKNTWTKESASEGAAFSEENYFYFFLKYLICFWKFPAVISSHTPKILIFEFSAFCHISKCYSSIILPKNFWWFGKKIQKSNLWSLMLINGNYSYSMLQIKSHHCFNVNIMCRIIINQKLKWSSFYVKRNRNWNLSVDSAELEVRLLKKLPPKFPVMMEGGHLFFVFFEKCQYTNFCLRCFLKLMIFAFVSPAYVKVLLSNVVPVSYLVRLQVETSIYLRYRSC